MGKPMIPSKEPMTKDDGEKMPDVQVVMHGGAPPGVYVLVQPGQLMGPQFPQFPQTTGVGAVNLNGLAGLLGQLPTFLATLVQLAPILKQLLDALTANQKPTNAPPLS